jgi:hypothetical protein
MNRVVRNVILSLVLSASGLAADAAGKHALLGRWSVDVATVQSPNPPKSVTLTLTEAGQDSYRMVVTIEAPDGSKQTSEGAFKPDGSANRVEGNQDFDVVSMTMPNRHTLVMAGGFGGHPSSTRIWTLADDGKHMVETAIRHLPDGTPYQRVVTWTRQASP